jgi:hypothetical protein
MDYQDILLKGIVILIAPAIILCLVIIIVYPFMLIHDVFYPPTSITIVKSDWECTSTYQKRVFNGKVWIDITECSQYNLKGIK